MRLKKQLLVEASRGKNIQEDEAMKILESKCKDSWNYFIKTGRSMVRGMGFKGDFYVIDPKSSTRESRNTDNYYTLLIDGDKHWAKYPKRSKSIIMANSKDKASNYGQPYRVFPYDGSNIGVAPAGDLWDSFTKGFGISNYNLNQFNSDLEDISDIMRVDGLWQAKTEDEIKKVIRNISNMIHDDVDFIDRLKEKGETDELPSMFWHYKWNHGDKGVLFQDWLHNIALNPKTNGFKTISTKQIGSVIGNGKKELWTDGKSVMITWQEAHYKRLEKIG